MRFRGVQNQDLCMGLAGLQRKPVGWLRAECPIRFTELWRMRKNLRGGVRLHGGELWTALQRQYLFEATDLHHLLEPQLRQWQAHLPPSLLPRPWRRR